MPNPRSENWHSYNAAQQGRPVRPFARQISTLAGPGLGRVAVELGSGSGTETRFFAESGWRVHSYDGDASVQTTMEAMSAELPIIHEVTDLEHLASLPKCELIFSSATLPFLSSTAFARLWSSMVDALQPAGWLAVSLFGVNDTWAEGSGTFLDRAEVEHLLEGMTIHLLDEQEYDGEAFSGAKHWHTFHVIAQMADSR